MLAADCLCHQSLCHFHLGHLDEAARLLQAGSSALAELNGGTAEPHTADYYLARFWREQGRLGPALQLMLEVLARLGPEVNGGTGGNATLRAICGIEAGLAYARLGQPHRARAYIDAPRNLAAMQGRVDGLLLEAELARASGQPITELLQRALPFLPECIRTERWRWRVQLELSREMAPAAAIALMRANLAEAGEHQIGAALAPTRLMLLHAHQRANDVRAAHQQALLLEADLSHIAPMAVYAGEYFVLMTQACEAAGDGAAARRVLQRGLVWLDRARREHVPAAFQESFLERNAANRQLRALAQRLPA